jgi:hypothetical protein
MEKLWLAFLRGFQNTFGVAPIRRNIPTPEEEMGAVAVEIRKATASIDPETGRLTCCGTDGLSVEPFHAWNCPQEK